MDDEIAEPTSLKPRGIEVPAETYSRVKRILVDTLELDLDPESINDNAVVFEGDLFADSIQALEIITGIEDEFGILFDDDELGIEMFDSVANLVEIVHRKLTRHEESLLEDRIS